MAWPKIEFQLDGSRTEQTDCGPASVCVAIDFMTGGRLHPSTERVRDKMADQDETNPDDWARAIEGFSWKFKDLGLTPPKYKVVRGQDVEWLEKSLLWGRGVIIVGNYGVVKNRKPRLWNSTSFVGLHAMFGFNLKERTNGDYQCVCYDPLADGRTVGGKRMVKGPKWWDWPLFRETADRGWNGNDDKWAGIIVWKSTLLTPDTELTPPEPEKPDLQPALDQAMDIIDGTSSYLSDLEEEHASMGSLIDEMRLALGPDSDSESDAHQGIGTE